MKVWWLLAVAAALLVVPLQCVGSSRLDGTMALHCKGIGVPFTFVRLPLSIDEELTFEFINMAATLDKRADVTAQRCARGSCVSGTAQVRFDRFVWNKETSGSFVADFPEGIRIERTFRARARPKIKGHCE